MNKASFVVARDYQANRIFKLEDNPLNRDNCLLPFAFLRKEFAARGVDLQTSDINDPASSDIVIYNEMPQQTPDFPNSHLLIFESEVIRPDNWILDRHKAFRKVFTWHDSFVDNKHYFKFNFPNTIKLSPTNNVNRTKLLCLIAGNKTASHPLELYSERLKTIEWFEENAPDEFDFYGVGWDRKLIKPLVLTKVLKKLGLSRILPKRPSRCYKGIVNSKIETLKQYKFSICYENARDIPGYITEKIFDCFLAGCIPIYWGPKNITTHIPQSCFIDRRNFKSHQVLYDHIVAMSEKKVMEYQRNINDFLKSESCTPFSSEYFAKNLTKQIAIR